MVGGQERGLGEGHADGEAEPAVSPDCSTGWAARRPSTPRGIRAEIAHGAVLFIEGSADAEKTHVEDGIDTFVFRDGLIRVQTVRYTLLQK